MARCTALNKPFATPNWCHWLLASVLVVCCVLAAPTAFANVGPGEATRLATLENRLLGAVHGSEKPAERLSNLENLVFATTFAKDAIDIRIQRLEETLPKPSVSNDPQPTDPKITQPPLSHPVAAGHGSVAPAKHPSQSQLQPTSQPEFSNTPIVDEMELQAYGKVFATQPLENRLARLERRYLGTVQRGGLASRVDNLRWLILGATSSVPSDPNTDFKTDEALTPTHQQPYGSSQPSPYANRPGGLAPGALASTQPGVGGAASNGLGQQYGSAANPYGNGNPAAQVDRVNAINRLEHDILDTTHPNDPVNLRLTRLEEAVFSQSAQGRGLSEEERLQRLMAVAVAKEDADTLGQSQKGGLRQLFPLLPIILLMLL